MDTCRATLSAGIGETRLAELLRLVAARQHGAFAELYDRAAPKVLAVARAVTQDVSHAEEVTQEVFLEIWQKAATFDETLGTATGWLLRITRCRAIDRVRSTSAGRSRDNAFSRDTIRPDLDSVIVEVLQRSDALLLYVALAGLSHVQREAITFTYLHGRTYREASVVLGVPLPAFKTRIRDGLLALQGIVASPVR